MPENLREEAFDLWLEGEAGASGTAPRSGLFCLLAFGGEIVG